MEDWARRYYSASAEHRAHLRSKWEDRWLAIFREYAGSVLESNAHVPRVLDLGCGGGQSSYLISFGASQGIGMENSLDALLDYPPERRREGLALVNADAVRIPFRDGAFDVVGTNAVLEHLSDLEAVLDEITRVLAPGGAIVIVGPNMLSPFHAVKLLISNLRAGRKNPDGTLREILCRSARSIKKLASRDYEFLYRAPHIHQLEFPGSDYDDICLISPMDMAKWAKAKGFSVISRPTGSSVPGRVISRILPSFSGGMRMILTRRAG
jgi:SAM-dependent methyltransferase